MKVHCILNHEHTNGDCVLGGGFEMKENYTETPWKVTKNNGLVFPIYRADNNSPVIAVVRFSDNPLATKEIGRANAEFIVRAVNNFERLLEALKHAQEFVAFKGGIELSKNLLETIEKAKKKLT